MIRIVFFGSSRFSVPVLRALVRGGYTALAVVSTPPKPKGRKKELSQSPVSDFARRGSLLALEPEKLREVAAKIKDFNPTLGVVASYARIIPNEILEIPNLGVVNVHPSLLPRWRGPSPIQSALLSGETQTGVTIHVTTGNVDAGDILAVREMPILSEWGYLELEEKLAIAGGELLVEILPKIVSGSLPKIKQKEQDATYSKKIVTGDGEIYWNNTAENIGNQVRALNPEPSTFTFLENNLGQRKRLIILKARVEKNRQDTLLPEPGTVIQIGEKFMVAAKNGFIIPSEIQIEGKKKTTPVDFLRGNSWIIGKTFRQHR